MIDFSEILSKIQSVNKNLLSKKTTDLNSHDLYSDSSEMAEHISFHAVKGVFPKKLFANRSPNETDKEAEYIEKNYKQYTLPVFVDYISTITRPFGDGNWSIEYEQDDNSFKAAEKTFQQYVESEIPIYGSLENFIKYILPSIKSIDANGFIGIRPKEFSYSENDDGERVLDSQSLIEPTMFYYESKNVVCFEQNEYYLFLGKEKSIVEYAGKKEQTGNVYEFYTKEGVYFYNQIGKKIDNEFEIIEFYPHDLGWCPVIQLMGIPNIKEDRILWQSPFLYSVDILDIVTTNSNWLQASINSCVFPVKVMYGDACEFLDSTGAHCNEGYLFLEGNKRTCPSCNGTGLKSRLSPLGTLLLNPKSRTEDGDSAFNQKPLEYISPSVETLVFIRDKIENDLQKSRAILHLQSSNSIVKGTENMTATGMVIDNKSMYAFIKPISDQIFHIYEFILNAIGEMRYGESFNPPKLSYPKTFDFKTSEDYLNDLNSAISNNLPPSFIQTVLLQYINSYYADNEIMMSIFQLILKADTLFGLSQDDINMKLARGTVLKWQDILHTSALNFINEIISEDSEFLNKDSSVQIEALVNLAKEKVLDIQNSAIGITKELLPDENGGGVYDAVNQDVDILGKFPLALQQLALARERANTAGDALLSKKIAAKMMELLKVIDP